jgi:hypothetical protein
VQGARYKEKSEKNFTNNAQISFIKTVTTESQSAQSDMILFICWEERFQQMKNALPSAKNLKPRHTQKTQTNGYLD